MQMKLRRLLPGSVGVALASALTLAPGAAFAAVWRWGCMGAIGNDQIALDRGSLFVSSGKKPIATLDGLVFPDDPGSRTAHPADTIQIVAKFLRNDDNDGLSSTMTFTSGGGERKLTLTELSSKKIAHKRRLIESCRDEITDRYRKTYRVERDKEPPVTVTLICMEYMLSTRGGRICK
jgi:hypothetical protein